MLQGINDVGKDEMTATDVALEHVFQSGNHAAVPRITQRAQAQAPRVLNDYCLFDEQGTPVGTIAAAYTRPRLGKNAPTLYLGRALGVFALDTASASE
jgi:hypothetical protein